MSKFDVYLEASKKKKGVTKDKVGKVMREFKKGKLKTSAGAKVTDRKQALAIGMSEKKRAEAGK